MELALPLLGTIGYSKSGPIFPTFKRLGIHALDHIVPHPRNNYHPHLLGHRVLGLFSMLLVAVKVSTILLITAGPVLPAYSSAITQSTVVDLTNQSRQAFGLADLVQNNKLQIAAQSKADDMLAKGYFAHNTPDGKTPWDFIKKTGYSYIVAGENLAVDFQQAESVEDAWMNSPGHRANILNKDFEEIGIGISQGQFQGHESIFVVQMFGTRPGQPIQTLAESSEVQKAPSSVVSQVPTSKPQASVESANTQPKNQSLVFNTEVNQASPQTQISPSPLLLEESLPLSFEIVNNELRLSVVAGGASKVLARYGSQAVMLDPKSDTLWQGSVPLSSITIQGGTLTVEAYDLQGNLNHAQVASFSPSLANNYSGVQPVAGATLSLFGYNFDPHKAEQAFYLTFVTLILITLAVAIGVHRHIQNIGMVANGSFVAIVAMLLWISG